MVKGQCGKSLQATSTAQDAEINQIISDTQSVLAGEFNFPFLKSRWSLNVPAGQRYTAFPTVTDTGVQSAPVFERPEEAWVKWNMIWQPIVYGIDEYPEFNYLDSDRNQVLDPVQRWQFANSGQFEVWPIPASGAQVRYVGQRQLTPLTTLQTLGVPGGGSVVVPGGGVVGVPPGTWVWNDAAQLDLDDILVSLFASAEYLTRKESARAPGVLASANRRLASELGAYPTRTETICIGRGDPMSRRMVRQVPLVLVAGK